MKKREEGFYWVKQNDDSDWEPARYLGDTEWDILRWENKVLERDFYKIGSKIEIPYNKESQI